MTTPLTHTHEIKTNDKVRTIVIRKDGLGNWITAREELPGGEVIELELTVGYPHDINSVIECMDDAIAHTEHLRN